MSRQNLFQSLAGHGKDRAVLLGNGFSIQHFTYKMLLEKTNLENSDPLKVLFDALDTYDFEAVIGALENASVVETAYGNKQRSKALDDDANRLRDALVHAVRATPPPHRDDIAEVIPSCVQFLRLLGEWKRCVYRAPFLAAIR
jgi:hypothetical protein